MFTKKKIALCTMLVSACLSTSAIAAATSSSKLLQLSWSGVVPVSPVVTGEWKFVDLNDPTKDYVATVGSINVQQGANGKDKGLETSEVKFGIKATVTNNAFTDNTDITAYLVSNPVFQGLNPTDATVRPEMKIYSGANELKTGSGNAVSVSKISGAVTDFVPVSLIGRGSLPEKSFTEGDVFTVNSAVMFTASVGTP